MIFQHARFQIWNQNQHPFLHNISDFAYGNPSLPGVSNIEAALDYMVAVLYPNSMPAVATPGDLPLVGNNINDYRVVNDDGDGKAAGYRWEKREGEASPSWHKIYDLDWGTDSILQAWQNRTQDLFVMRYGYDDIDGSGVPVTGLYAGQRVWGGASPNTNLTLSANSGDGVGAPTGFVQVTDNFRPTQDSSISLGTNTERWLKGWFDELQSGTLNLQSGLITDSSGQISFGAMDLDTTGDLTVGTMLIQSGSIVDSGGSIDFGANALTTTGMVTADSVEALGAASKFAASTEIANFTFTAGNIACTDPAIDFNALDLTTTGILTAEQLNINDIRIDDNIISVSTVNTDMIISANGIGQILLTSDLATSNAVTITNTLSVIGQLNADSLRLDGNTISSTNINGPINIAPNGTGQVSVSSTFFPTVDSSLDLGKTGQVWNKLWIDGSIGGATEITITDLLALRNVNYRDSGRTQPAQAGDALFYDGTTWLASAPDSEIAHSGLSGLTTGDAGHTQFALLAGRGGGQSLIGGTASGENLDLESTSNATKGFIQVKNTLRPFTDASFSGGWTGTDLGHSARRWNDVYTAGEFKGLRLENLGATPASSSQKIGRLVYVSADENVYVDTGTALKQVGGARFYVDTVWNGTDTTKTVTVSGTDARLAIWQLKDNVNDFEVMYVEIKSPSATSVTINTGTPLPAGTYRLVGV